jgi:hypothetical protein
LLGNRWGLSQLCLGSALVAMLAQKLILSRAGKMGLSLWYRGDVSARAWGLSRFCPSIRIDIALGAKWDCPLLLLIVKQQGIAT